MTTPTTTTTTTRTGPRVAPGQTGTVSSYRAEEMEFVVHHAHEPSRRTLVLVALLLGTLALTGSLVDRQLRRAETVAVERCAASAHAAVEYRLARVASMANYVRPALYGRFPGAVGDGLVEMISTEARAVVGTLEEARTVCARIELLPHHATLRQRKAACLDYVDRHAAFLEAVAADGLAAYRGSPGSGGAC